MLSAPGAMYARPMTMVTTYSNSNGKFPTAYGNVALLDCNYFLGYIYDYLLNDYINTLPITERFAFRLAVLSL